MVEIYKKIKGFENYEISNLGNVKSLNYRGRGEEKTLCLKIDKKGYRYISLSKEGITKNFKVHRLVAEAFIPNPNNYPIINHKDENPSNNCVFINEDGTVDLEKSNIEWCTHKYNVNYGECQEKRLKTRQITYVVSRDTKKKISESLKKYFSTKTINN